MALSSVLGPAEQPKTLHEPVLGQLEKEYLLQCIDSGYVSSVGAFVDRFEQELASLTGSPFVVATVNGTAALHVALLLAGVRPGDEVLIPSLSFIATANAVIYCGATPHFCDIDEQTLGLNPVKLTEYLSDMCVTDQNGCVNKNTGARIGAVVPMHTFGSPVEMEGLLEVADSFSIPVVEDAAEALGSFYRGRHCGTLGQIGVLSFNGNKIITTGGGGAILTADKKLADAARHLTTTAKAPHPWKFMHDKVGYNYRMPNINAALGMAQLEQLQGFLEAKKNLAARYAEAFAEVKGMSLFTPPDGSVSNYWLNAVLLNSPESGLLEMVLKAAGDEGYICRPAWTPLHLLQMFRECPSMDMVVTEDMSQKIINLPSSANL